MLVDTHCHLNFKAFEDDVGRVIKRARGAGVRRIIIPGAAVDTSLRAVELAKKFEGVYATVGIHPHHVEKVGKNIEEEILKLSNKSGKVVGVGETGLDYFKAGSRGRQKDLFRSHLELARRRGLPVVIHNREAGGDVLRIINNFKGKIRGVFHCFSGDEVLFEKVIKRGFYVGIDGNVTYNRSLQGLVKKIPLKSLLLETDSPFLTPIPCRGLRNEPKNVRIVAEFVAKIKEVSLGKIAKETTRNAKRLFKI